MLFRYWVYLSFMFLVLFFPPFYFCSLHYHHHRTPSAHHQSLDSLHHPLIISLTPITVNHHPLLSAIKLSLLLSFSVNGIRTSFRTSLLGILRLCKTVFRDARIIASGVTLWIVYATKYVVVVWGSEECSAYVLWRGDVLSDLSHTLHLLTLHFHTHFIFTHASFSHTLFSHTSLQREHSPSFPLRPYSAETSLCQSEYHVTLWKVRYTRGHEKDATGSNMCSWSHRFGFFFIYV